MQVNRDNLRALLKRSPRKDNKFEFLRRVEFGMLKKKFKALLSDFGEYNKELECFTARSEQLEPCRASSGSVFNPPLLLQIRSYTKSIYNVFCVGMSCQASHRARMRLEDGIAASGKARFELRRPTESEQRSCSMFQSIYVCICSMFQSIYVCIECSGRSLMGLE
jgi:hypothetical protein